MPISAQQSCVMATDQESNNLDEFDLEEVINWEEHNYASKNLEIQQLPDLDLPTDIPVSAQSALPGTPTTVSHGLPLLLTNQVIGSHQQASQDQNASIMALPQVSTSSVLNPVFPQSCMITDIPQQLVHSSRVRPSSRHLEPAFPSENFDLPSINHQSALVSTGSQPMNFMTAHSSQVGSIQLPPGQQLGHAGHTLSRHRTLPNGIQSFKQSTLTSNIPNLPVNEPLNPTIENDDGGDSIDQLIEDIVDRDMPQGLGDAVVFSSASHGLTLGNRHQPMHHVINPRSSSPNQLAAMVRGHSSGTNGSPLASGSQIPSVKSLNTSMPHANSPLSQNPASPIKAPSPQMPQYKASVPLRPSRGGNKTTVKLPNQQQPHSPQNIAIGVVQGQGQGQVHSPRPTSQRSPQQPGNAHSPPSATNSIISQNIPSPLAQMPPLASGASQIIGNLGVQHSPVASPMNISSPQSQRPSRQASPGLCNIASPVSVVTQEFSKHQSGVGQGFMTQASTAKVPAPQKQNNLQNANSLRQVNITQPNVVRTQGNAPHLLGNSISTNDTNRGSMWGQNQFVSTQDIERTVTNDETLTVATDTSSQGQSKHPPMEQDNMDIQSNSSQSQQEASVSLTSANQTQATSTFDTAAVLRGLNALRGSNVLPVALKQSANTQQLQAVKLPKNVANIDFLKQAMLLKAGGQAGTAQNPGNPLSVNMSQGQVFYYILPKGTNIVSNSGSITQSTPGQQIKMVFINTKSTSGNTSVKTVNSTVDGTARPSAQVFSLNNNFTTVNSSLVSSVVTQPVVPSFASITTQLSSSTPQNHMLFTSLASKVLSSHGDSVMTPTLSQPHIASSFDQQQTSTLDPNFVSQLVSGQGASNINIPSNPSSIPSGGTAEITFVNECTAVDHLVSVTGMSPMTGNLFTTHPVTSPVSTTVSNATVVSSSTQPSVAVGDSDDSDTPLAVVAESLRKASGEEKKKKKKKKGEKRKKKEKSPGGPEKSSSAFQLFFKETQAAIRQQNPSAQFSDVAKIVKQMWENLSEDHKKVYFAKHEKVKAEKASNEPSPKIRKLVTPTGDISSPISSPKTISHPSSSLITTTVNKDPTKPQESITLKISKSVLNKNEPPVKVAKVTSTTLMGKTTTTGSTSSPPVKAKKPKMSINPISQRICIREGCNMPARTTKERGTQYCSNDCIIAHCRLVFKSWVSQRRMEVPVS